ncbi:hypothetical protein NVP1101O_128 [Vibrio phage 1.101.O._10N.261.45.C6]|nr:hypothetical protein NVP1101O_128 [Vibrio phage 1.101.O._10N.261.45.C6]
MKEFEWDIKLDDSWFEYDYTKFQDKLKEYRKQRSVLNDIEHEATKPVACKSWTKDYYFGDEPKNKAQLWAEISEYIEEESKKEGWTYCNTETEMIDVNTDPYDDYEQLTPMYTVYAFVDKGGDFRECLEYKTQYNVVSGLYAEVIELKSKIDMKLKEK